MIQISYFVGTTIKKSKYNFPGIYKCFSQVNSNHSLIRNLSTNPCSSVGYYREFGLYVFCFADSKYTLEYKRSGRAVQGCVESPVIYEVIYVSTLLMLPTGVNNPPATEKYKYTRDFI